MKTIFMVFGFPVLAIASFLISLDEARKATLSVEACCSGTSTAASVSSFRYAPVPPFLLIVPRFVCVQPPPSAVLGQVVAQ